MICTFEQSNRLRTVVLTTDRSRRDIEFFTSSWYLLYRFNPLKLPRAIIITAVPYDIEALGYTSVLPTVPGLHIGTMV